jgi:hypothetical protein
MEASHSSAPSRNLWNMTPDPQGYAGGTVTAEFLVVVASCKSSINLITDPNPAYDH